MKLRVLVFTLAGGWMMAASAETLTIRADEWFPMNGEPDSDQPGYMIELAREILKPRGHQVDYGILPWERALREVRAGRFDCVVGAYKTEAPDFVFPEEPWGIDSNEFFVRKGESWRFTGLESLQGKVFGLIGGYDYSGSFGEYLQANKDSPMFQFINGNNGLENNIRKVLAGRVTATVESPAVMRAKLKEMGLSGELEPAGALDESSPMYIACSPAKASSQDYVRMFDEGIRELRANGKLREILARYGLEDWGG